MLHVTAVVGHWFNQQPLIQTTTDSKVCVVGQDDVVLSAEEKATIDADEWVRGKKKEGLVLAAQHAATVKVCANHATAPCGVNGLCAICSQPMELSAHLYTLAVLVGG